MKKFGRHNRLIKINMLRTDICDENNNSLKLQPNNVCWICVVQHVKDVLLEQINLGWFMAMEEKLNIEIIKCCL